MGESLPVKWGWGGTLLHSLSVEGQNDLALSQSPCHLNPIREVNRTK